ncbi:DUF1289 domain-containing protein [Caenimonas koreensis DSM 17982]|uniref:DUF1289 domain-containing protein n=1 Tax=Caenimonas koreensis DSM 17982 TaxID=1121255 RepID=A0A844ARV2_9BURK|nr:DUF1289 domain-containing protein [Caenimonas koreensis DSM 17982]
MSAATFLAKQVRLVDAGLVAEVPSPCLSVCRMDPATDFCEGCMRTIDEIAAWGRMGDDEKRSVWKLIGIRLDASAQEP